MGGDFDIWVLPWGGLFDIAETRFGKKAVPRGGGGVGPGLRNLTLAS